jgi:DNA-binding response OmpR family regulator
MCGYILVQERVLRVRVIDSDPSIGIRVGLMPIAAGIEVKSPDSGHAALNHLTNTQREPDLTLLNLQMPGIGVEVVRQAYRADVPCRLVVCSACRATVAKRELGTQHALDTPFEPDALLETVCATIGTRR